MKKDAAAYVKRCDKCQRYAPIPHMPSATLKSVSGPWPFAQWGMDIVGPLPVAPAQKKFLLVATDYFSKWVEAEAYASIKDKDVTKFVWKNIVCRFGIPQTIIADNGPQFDSIAFKNFCSELNIRNSYSTPRYPQSNGQAEATNKTLITALKKRLEQAKGKWVEELPGVLWAYRTTPGRPTGNTPFALAYGMDAVIPTEIGLPTIWTDAAKQSDANTELGRNLDWANEVRESAAIRMADNQQRASAHYNRKVKLRSFKNGILVLRKVFENTAEIGAGKFQANWEGPYIVSKASESGAYHLQNFSLSAANSRSSSSFCAVKRSYKSSFCFFSIEASVRSCLTSPLSRATSSSASCKRTTVDSSRLFASTKSARRASFSPERWINWLRPPPVSGAGDLHYLCAEWRRPSCNHWSAAAKRASGASRIINGTPPPPDEATEGDSSSELGPQHFRPDGARRVHFHPGPPPEWLESQLPSPPRPPPDKHLGRMSN
ncbi:Transposon Ty3-I Gag-Pol polyprotein [Vitis vinifera]|uniref:Transposon Ty3-I Gag-Pol polyprotein n=1 Tax=Vitis vinifera TaxID=29760 RepID=A0A438IVZ2_VITVI|nr:Transposon Ty3-I Gag-Pol polyprotein [Vitis vinifera]